MTSPKPPFPNISIKTNSFRSRLWAVCRKPSFPLSTNDWNKSSETNHLSNSRKLKKQYFFIYLVWWKPWCKKVCSIKVFKIVVSLQASTKLLRFRENFVLFATAESSLNLLKMLPNETKSWFGNLSIEEPEEIFSPTISIHSLIILHWCKSIALKIFRKICIHFSKWSYRTLNFRSSRYLDFMGSIWPHIPSLLYIFKICSLSVFDRMIYTSSNNQINGSSVC